MYDDRLKLYDAFGDGWDTASLVVVSTKDSFGDNFKRTVQCGVKFLSDKICVDVNSFGKDDYLLLKITGLTPAHSWDVRTPCHKTFVLCF